MRVSNCEGGWWRDIVCGVCDCRSCEELIDALIICIAGVFEKDYLKQYVGVEKLYKQEDYEQDVGP